MRVRDYLKLNGPTLKRDADTPYNWTHFGGYLYVPIHRIQRLEERLLRVQYGATLPYNSPRGSSDIVQIPNIRQSNALARHRAWIETLRWDPDSQSARVRLVHGIPARVRVWLLGLGHQRIDAQELPGLRVVVAPYLSVARASLRARILATATPSSATGSSPRSNTAVAPRTEPGAGAR